jgi:predicted RNA-binding Zn-ribbon protein involved in translation (DUF1610 family)
MTKCGEPTFLGLSSCVLPAGHDGQHMRAAPGTESVPDKCPECAKKIASVAMLDHGGGRWTCPACQFSAEDAGAPRPSSGAMIYREELERAGCVVAKDGDFYFTADGQLVIEGWHVTGGDPWVAANEACERLGMPRVVTFKIGSGTTIDVRNPAQPESVE